MKAAIAITIAILLTACGPEPTRDDLTAPVDKRTFDEQVSDCCACLEQNEGCLMGPVEECVQALSIGDRANGNIYCVATGVPYEDEQPSIDNAICLDACGEVF